MKFPDQLPDSFLRFLKDLEASYLESDDPICQSGFGGGAQRWRAEREPILDAVQSDGDLLDIGCANGYLLEYLVQWGLERGIRITPYGLDQGAHLVELARKRLPQFLEHLFVGNAWDWQPPRRFRYVYTLFGCVPQEYLKAYIDRLLSRTVESGGRLIFGACGRYEPPEVLLGVAILSWESFVEAWGGSEDFSCERTSFVVNIIGITKKFL